MDIRCPEERNRKRVAQGLRHAEHGGDAGGQPNTYRAEHDIRLAGSNHRRAQETGVQFARLGVGVIAAQARHRSELDRVPGLQIAQLAERDRNFDEVGVLFWIKQLARRLEDLGRAVELLEPDTTHIREASVQSEYPLSDVQSQRRPDELSILPVGIFIAEQAGDRGREVCE